MESEESGGRAKFRDCVFMRYKELCIRVANWDSRVGLAGKAEICEPRKSGIRRMLQMVVCALIRRTDLSQFLKMLRNIIATYIYICILVDLDFVVNTCKQQLRLNAQLKRSKCNYTLPTCNIFYVR